MSVDAATALTGAEQGHPTPLLLSTLTVVLPMAKPTRNPAYREPR